MPNLIRRNRGHHPPPLLRYPVLRDLGTRLSFRGRDIAYSLHRHAGWTHERIGGSLSVSRDTISASLRRNT